MIALGIVSMVYLLLFGLCVSEKYIDVLKWMIAGYTVCVMAIIFSVGAV